jgi:hypothetical protein
VGQFGLKTHAFVIVLGLPALVFAIFGSLGLNPIRAAAWGAILGMAALGFAFFEERPSAYHPRLTPTPADETLATHAVA